jgi:hypothetical protein
MNNRAVTSREYKMMLNTDRFFNRAEGVKNFFSLIQFLIAKTGGSIISNAPGEKHRKTFYLDTPQFAMRQNGLSLRIREENSRFKLNLKCRNSDRYISAAKELTSSQIGKIEFEEDIIPPFNSKFSHSNTIKFDTLPVLNLMKDLILLFPSLKNLGIDENAPVKTANDFQVLEVIQDICTFQFESSTPINASLSFWYLANETDFPIVGEFSFKYGAVTFDEGSLEDFSLKTAEGSNNFFKALQNHPGWLDLNMTTKTAFALDVL